MKRAVARVRRVRSPAFVVTAVLALTVVAAEAQALCPNCLGQNRSLTPTLELLGAFLLVPFVVAFFVLRAIRRATR